MVYVHREEKLFMKFMDGNVNYLYVADERNILINLKLKRKSQG